MRKVDMYEKVRLIFYRSDSPGSGLLSIEGECLSQESIDELVKTVQVCNKRDNLGIDSVRTDTTDEGSFT